MAGRSHSPPLDGPPPLMQRAFRRPPLDCTRFGAARMLASRLRTTRAVAGGLALASLLCWVPGSQAAVHTGSATDAADDLSLFAGDQLPDPPTSFTNVTVKYEDAAGRVDVAYTFDQVPSAGQEIHAGVGLGTTRADGSCSAPFFTSLGWHVLAGEGRGESVVEGHSTNFVGHVTGEIFSFDERNGVGVHVVVRVAWSPEKLELRDHKRRRAGRQALQLRDRGHVDDRQLRGRHRPRRGLLGEQRLRAHPRGDREPCPAAGHHHRPPPSLRRGQTSRPTRRTAPSRVFPDSRAPRLAEQ